MPKLCMRTPVIKELTTAIDLKLQNFELKLQLALKDVQSSIDKIEIRFTEVLKRVDDVQLRMSSLEKRVFDNLLMPRPSGDAVM